MDLWDCFMKSGKITDYLKYKSSEGENSSVDNFKRTDNS